MKHTEMIDGELYYVEFFNNKNNTWFVHYKNHKGLNNDNYSYTRASSEFTISKDGRLGFTEFSPTFVRPATQEERTMYLQKCKEQGIECNLKTEVYYEAY